MQSLRILKSNSFFLISTISVTLSEQSNRNATLFYEPWMTVNVFFSDLQDKLVINSIYSWPVQCKSKHFPVQGRLWAVWWTVQLVFSHVLLILKNSLLYIYRRCFDDNRCRFCKTILLLFGGHIIIELHLKWDVVIILIPALYINNISLCEYFTVTPCSYLSFVLLECDVIFVNWVFLGVNYQNKIKILFQCYIFVMNYFSLKSKSFAFILRIMWFHSICCLLTGQSKLLCKWYFSKHSVQMTASLWSY